MENLNLATSEKNERVIGTGTLKLAALLILVLLVYVGLLFYGNFLTKKSASLDAQYKSQYENFMNNDSKKVIDFQNRLVISKNLIGSERNMNKDIDAVRAAISKGTYLDSYKYDDTNQTITLNCYADNYDTVAKQIQSFKGSDYFSAVVMGETKLDPKTNVINFSITLKIK